MPCEPQDAAGAGAPPAEAIQRLAPAEPAVEGESGPGGLQERAQRTRSAGVWIRRDAVGYAGVGRKEMC